MTVSMIKATGDHSYCDADFGCELRSSGTYHGTCPSDGQHARIQTTRNASVADADVALASALFDQAAESYRIAQQRLQDAVQAQRTAWIAWEKAQQLP